jgi:hypothetical protein
LEVKLAVAETQLASVTLTQLAGSGSGSGSGSDDGQGHGSEAGTNVGQLSGPRQVPSVPGSSASLGSMSAVEQAGNSDLRTLVGAGESETIQLIEPNGDGEQPRAASSNTRTTQLMIENYHRLMLTCKQNCAEEVASLHEKHTAALKAMELDHAAQIEAVQVKQTADRCEKRPLFSQLFLCLSRACLGKMIGFIYKLLKKGVFSQGIQSLRVAAAQGRARRVAA